MAVINVTLTPSSRVGVVDQFCVSKYINVRTVEGDQSHWGTIFVNCNGRGRNSRGKKSFVIFPELKAFS